MVCGWTAHKGLLASDRTLVGNSEPLHRSMQGIGVARFEVQDDYADFKKMMEL